MQGGLAFVLPPESHLVSGGNIYNQRFIRALEELRAVRPVPPVRVLSPDAWAQEVDQGRAGVFLVDSLCLDALHACLPRRRPGQYFCLIVHHLPSLEPDIDPGDPALAVERAVLPRLDGFLATSAYTREVLVGQGLGREPGRAAARRRNAAPIATVPPALPACDIPPLAFPGRFRGLMVGNLIRRKAVLALLEALAARVTPSDRFTLDIAGRLDLDADYAARCAQLVARTDALRGAVHIRGPVPYEDMGACYRQASVLVSAARMETYGMALQEARRYGVPILAYDGGNARNHFEDGKNGCLHGSIESLADGCVALMRDGARARALFEAAQAMRTDGSYTWQVAAARFLDQIAAWPAL